jgi:hypothetical protein
MNNERHKTSWFVVQVDSLFLFISSISYSPHLSPNFRNAHVQPFRRLPFPLGTTLKLYSLKPVSLFTEQDYE